MALTKEERAAKFAAKSSGPGLVSRGNKKLSKDEQKRIFEDLKHQTASVRLAHLRSLRESLLSTSLSENTSKGFEQEVYKASVIECIEQNTLEVLPHILQHLCSISSEHIWHKLYLIVLSNSQQFNDALIYCTNEKDEMYLSSVLLKDCPLFESLVDEEIDPLALKLMKCASNIFEREREHIKIAYR